jgi:predicted ATP-grasp superfamily ATP-dependent carboligase
VTAACGVRLDSGLAMLEAATEEIWWRGRSRLLLHACVGVLPGMRFSSCDEPSSPGSSRRRRVALAIAPDLETTGWASKYGIELVLPSSEVMQNAGDKIVLGNLALAAGVGIPDFTVIRGLDGTAVDRLWEGVPLVVQRPENDLTGSGTRFVEDRATFTALCAEWNGVDVKVAEHCEGLPLTVSGCVMPNRTFVTGISHQLVGFNRLTPVSAAHCGNQLLADDELPEPVVSECRSVGARLGDELRNIGFLGMFGLDLLASASGVRVVEINPRIQGVSSLLHAAERAAGLLPTPGAHILGFLGVDANDTVTATLPPLSVSQIFVYARQVGKVGMTLPSGVFELVDGELCHVDVAPRFEDIVGRDDIALAWPFVQAGETVSPATRIIVLQFGRRVSSIDGSSELYDWVEPWIAAFENKLGLGAS